MTEFGRLQPRPLDSLRELLAAQSGRLGSAAPFALAPGLVEGSRGVATAQPVIAGEPAFDAPDLGTLGLIAGSLTNRLVAEPLQAARNLGRSAMTGEPVSTGDLLAVPAAGGLAGALAGPRGASLAAGAARRARPSTEREFTIDAFHGTTSPVDFRRFDPNAPTQLAGKNPAEFGASFFSRDPEVADIFAGGPSGRVFPVKIKPGKTQEFDLIKLIDADDPEFLGALKASVQRRAQERGVTMQDAIDARFETMVAGLKRQVAESRGVRNRLRADGFADAELPPVTVPFSGDLTGAVTQMSLRKGLDTATIKGLREGGGPGGPDSDQVLVFNPANVRSRFARFDPAQASSADILASNPAAAVGIPIAREPDEL